MELTTERGRDRLPESLLTAADNLVARLRPSQYPKLYRLASNARQQIMGSPQDWSPFKELLRDFNIALTDRNHATALMLALMPQVLKQEKRARSAAANEARKRMGRKRAKPERVGRGELFSVSSASSSSIEKGADKFPLALERLAKK